MLTLAFLVNMSSSISAMDVNHDGAGADAANFQPEQLTAAQLEERYRQNEITLKNQRRQARQEAQLEREIAQLMNPQPGCARNLLQDFQQGE